MPALEMPSLTLDEIDDLLYFTRANETDDLQQTLLELSQKYNCSQGDVVLACADPESGNTLLHYCSANGFSDLLKTILTYLGLQPSNDTEFRDGGPAAMIINKPNNEGNTPLHWASVNGQLDVVKILVSAGADVSKANAAGHLPVFEAERAGKGNVVEFLLDQIQQNVNPEELVDISNIDDDSTNGTRHTNGNFEANMDG